MRDAEGAAGMGERSKRRLIGNRSDRDCARERTSRGQHHPTRKRADFRLVFAHESMCGRGKNRSSWRWEQSQLLARACVPDGTGTR